MFGMESARDFLRGNFGTDISQFFLTSALPVMRSDFFSRVLGIFSGRNLF